MGLASSESDEEGSAMLGNAAVFLFISLLSSVATFGSDHSNSEGVFLLIIALVTFLLGTTEAILWAVRSLP